jgi:RNA polymerase sigma-70 factor (ECF subfamily)
MTPVVALPIENHPVASPQPAAMPKPRRNQEGLSTRDLEAFVRDYWNRLMAVANRLLRCEDDAADAVQNAFLSALVSRHTFQGDSTVYTWLYRIVVNACLMKLRSQANSRMVCLDDFLAEVDGNRFPSRSVPSMSSCVSAPACLERIELRAAVRRGIDRLPEQYRTIVLLRDIEQLSTNQTAKLLDMSRAAVKTRLHRARQALRALLEPVIT